MTDPAPEPGTLAALDCIAAALSQLQGELAPIHRDTDVTVKTDKGQYSYSFADLASITRTLYPLLAKHDLAFTAGPRITERGQFVLAYRLLHSSGQSIDGEYPLPVDVKSPQAMGSAITYARRYCLCAVTGVVTDDDDGAAAQHAARDQDMRPADPERAAAVAQVGAAWVAQYGGLPDGSPDWQAIGAAFTKWSNGKRSTDVPPAELRRFAGYLSNLPVKDAGGTPGEQPAAGEPAQDAGDPSMKDRTRKMLFALWNKQGVTDRQDQLTYARSVLGREVESRSDLTEADAQQLIGILRSDADQ